MKKKIENLFINLWSFVTKAPFFLFIYIGGRGIGKTYSMLKGVLEDHVYFMYVRRTEAELETCCSAENNPFLQLNIDLNRNIEMRKSPSGYVIVEGDEIIGVAKALSTIGKVRGSSFPKVDYIIFDEFINTAPINTVKKEADLFFNMLETVQRNRELLGQDSIKVVLLSNANTIDSEILKTFKLGEVIHYMKSKNEHIYADQDRGLYLELLEAKELQNEKKETALYKLAKGTKFYDMSLNNEFTGDYFGDCKKIPFQQLIPICRYDKVTFFHIKNSQKIYASYRKAKCPTYDELHLQSFKRDYGYFIANYYIAGQLLYFDYDIKLYVKNIL